MKIVLVCMLHTYGDPEREYSYEYFNFYKSLKDMGHEVELYDYMGMLDDNGREGMNQNLIKLVKKQEPDLVVFSLYTDQFLPSTIETIKKYCKTFCFFHDDTWRVEYSRYWAGFFDYFSTPDCRGAIKYAELGLDNSVYFPFGCNEAVFNNRMLDKKYDVSFVGAWHPYREWLVKRLRTAGISVNTFGYKWPEGEVKQDEMVEIFNQSKINLNLSNSSSWDLRYLASSPRAIVNSIRSPKNIEQMKARVFEVAGCNAFQLTYFVEGLSGCYLPDEEIAVYADADDLIEKVKFYLERDELREEMAQKAYERTLSEHTFTNRFKRVFSEIGL